MVGERRFEPPPPDPESRAHAQKDSSIVSNHFLRTSKMLEVATIFSNENLRWPHQLLFANGKLLKRFGERGRNRTFNLLIKSQLLCQLSYAPLLWNQSDEGHHRKQYQCNTGFVANPCRERGAINGSTQAISAAVTMT